MSRNIWRDQARCAAQAAIGGRTDKSSICNAVSLAIRRLSSNWYLRCRSSGFGFPRIGSRSALLGINWMSG